MVGACSVKTAHEWVDKAAKRLLEHICHGVNGRDHISTARALRAAYRRGAKEERQRQNTCHVCGVSMMEPQTPPFCIDCGGCDEEKCGHLYIGGKR